MLFAPVKLSFALVIATVFVSGTVNAAEYEFAPIEYSKTPANDAVAELAKKIAKGEVKLEYDRTRGYLDSLLKALDVPISSQVLVFSKTSLQIDRIYPSMPRAVYFNDDIYIGWPQSGGKIEISAVDPKQGAIFYTLEQDRDEKVVPIRRTHECLACHANSRIGRVPGHIVRSVFPDKDGHPITRAGGFFSDHRTPYENRWGGWYVSGTHGKLTHMANRLAYERINGEIIMPKGGQNVTDLTKQVRLHAYPSKHSDVVALMVLEHQAMAHNLVTQVSYQTRMAMHQQADINKLLGNPQDQMRESTKRRIDNVVEKLVAYLLFAEETPMPGPRRRHVEVRRRVCCSRTVRQARPLTAPVRPRKAALQISHELPDLYRIVRLPARRRPHARVPTSLRRPHWQRHLEALRLAHRRRSQGCAGDSARDEERLAEVLGGEVNSSGGCLQPPVPDCTQS